MQKSLERPDTEGQTVQRLTRKRYTFRLPIALAARIEALCEMHPETPRHQLISDLLALGVAEVERAQGSPTGALPSALPDGKPPIYLLSGPFVEFHGLTRKHHLAMEHALDQDEVPPALLNYRLGNGD
jgi:hypothetical protein